MEQLKFNPRDIVYYIEKNNNMKLIKEAEYNRIKNLKSFKEINNKYIQLKKTNSNSGLLKVKDIFELNFYFIIDAESLFDKDSYFKLFFERKKVGSESLQEKHSKLLESMKLKQKNKLPKMFNNLITSNKLNGCYLVATIKTDKTKLTITNSSNTLSVKLDYNKKLPYEFEEMCKEYDKYLTQSLEQEKLEIEKFFSMKKQEQDLLIGDIIQSLSFSSNSLIVPPLKMLDDLYNILSIEKKSSGINKVKLEDLIKNDLGQINDVEFLNSMMNSAIEEENYELCSHIKERIKEIKKKN